MARVTLTRVSKTYAAGVHAVHDVSLDIADGEFVVLVGPSGCGKSTTLRMIAGLEDLSSGDISIGGRSVNNVHPKDRDIAMVFQNYALYPHMTVYKNLAFALTLRRIPRTEIDRRVRHAAEILELTDYLHRKPKALSGGQRQRVAVGRAIVREPKAFLFDEPLSNLDAKLRITTRGELKALHRRLRTTTVYVTHDQEEAMTLGDRVVVMADGRIQQADGPVNVYARPANRFVAGFIGTPPMNFIEGTASQDPHTPRWTAPGATLHLDPPPSLAPALAARPGKPTVLGIRPQAIAINPPHPHSAWTATVTSVEPLGAEVDLRLALDAVPGQLLARVPLTTAHAPGARVTLGFADAGLHLFEPGPFGPRCAHEKAEANAPAL